MNCFCGIDCLVKAFINHATRDFSEDTVETLHEITRDRRIHAIATTVVINDKGDHVARDDNE